jgi:hypothetical protein
MLLMISLYLQNLQYQMLPAIAIAMLYFVLTAEAVKTMTVSCSMWRLRALGYRPITTSSSQPDRRRLGGL